MKLTDREIELISNIPRNRRNRRLGLWLTMASILIMVVVGSYIDYDGTAVFMFLGGFLGGQAAAYFSTRSEDKLIDLVQRYVNSDPEAIRQVAARARASEGAA
jgi:hypothetical protein